MAVTTPPGSIPDAKPPPRTRTPTWLTSIVLVVTLVFGVWGVALVVLTTVGILEPAFYYTDQKSAIKALGSTVVALLALSQAWSMESAMGHLPSLGVKVRTRMRIHRWGGAIAIVLAALIAFFCMTDIGAPSEPVRVAVHIVFGASAFAVLAVKFALIWFRPTVAYNWAPWLGRYVAVAFVIVWISSGLAYYTGNL
jgi:hypothetical protein